MAREQFRTLTEPMYILLALTEVLQWDMYGEGSGAIRRAGSGVGQGTLYAMLGKFEGESRHPKNRGGGTEKVLCADEGKKC